MRMTHCSPFKTTTRTRNVSPFFNRFFDDDFFYTVAKRSGVANRANVNIAETDTSYDIEVAYAGLQKEDFTVSVEKDILTIAAEQKVNNTDDKDGKSEGKKYIRREFAYQSFKRSFYVPENVDASSITAQYNNGVLTVSLPKVTKEETKTIHTIEVS